MAWQAATGRYEEASYDPGSDDRDRAAALLDDARHRVQEAGDIAARTIAAGWADAPREPRWWESAGHFVAEIGRGAWEAATGLVEFVWMVSPVRMVVDPEGWGRDLQALGDSLLLGVTHPAELGKALIDWDTWQESPGRAIGHLVPDLLLALGTAGSGTAPPAASARRRPLATSVTSRPRSGAWTVRGSPVSGWATYSARSSGSVAPASCLSRTCLARRLRGRRQRSRAPRRTPASTGGGRRSCAPATRSRPGAWRGSVCHSAASRCRARWLTTWGRMRPGSTRACRSSRGAAPTADELTVLRATQDLDFGVGYAFANQQFGPGGLRQVFVPDLDRLVRDEVFEVVERRAMHRTTARIGTEVAAP